MIQSGATWLDVGGESTRPGAEKISIDEEIERVIPVISEIHNKYPEILISVDTEIIKSPDWRLKMVLK